ncbi:MAG: phosphatase PAP2 family protein, partial [Candidatus Kapabacteria bacterium]|nr:phosphatase PAP2 family protein [Candidatus Kapabacteria bacterium]
MIDFLYSIDLQIFNFLNQTLSCSVLDIVMSTITKVKYWIPLYVIGLACLIVKGGTKGRILVLLLLLGIGISDTLNSRIFK